jgi:hypothetical protein
MNSFLCFLLSESSAILPFLEEIDRTTVLHEEFEPSSL